jgi:hypothetical protein
LVKSDKYLIHCYTYQNLVTQCIFLLFLYLKTSKYSKKKLVHIEEFICLIFFTSFVFFFSKKKFPKYNECENNPLKTYVFIKNKNITLIESHNFYIVTFYYLIEVKDSIFFVFVIKVLLNTNQKFNM